MAVKSIVLTAEVVSICIMLVIMAGLLTEKNRARSTNALIVTFLFNIINNGLDAAWLALSGSGAYDRPIFILWVLAFGMASITMIAFLNYWYAFITEKTALNKLFFYIPVAAFALAFLYQLLVGFTGGIVTVSGGMAVQTNGIPVGLAILHVIALFYLPGVAFAKRKAIGLMSVLLLGTFGFFPLVAVFISFKVGVSFELVGSTLSLIFIYVLLQNHRAIEREQLLSRKNQELEADFKIFKSLGGIHAAMYYVDLEKNSFTEITCEEIVKKRIGQFGSPQEGLQFFVERLVLPAYQPELKAFVDLETLPARIGNEKIISKEYQSAVYIAETAEYKEMWRQVSFIDAGRNAEGKLTQVIFATHSIHERKTHELEANARLQDAVKAAEDANQAKSDFLFSMSHDIRTPMNAILGYSNLMKKELEDPKLLDYQEKIEKSGSLLLSIINHVLDMTHIESGKEELQEKDMCVSEIVKDLIEVIGEEAAQKDITLKSALNLQHDYIRCDITKVKEIFINIAGNAVKYTPAGGSVMVRINELPCDKPGYGRYQAVIEDTGIGMSPEFLPHIFDSFARERNTTTGKVAGTGLGMAIVKKLVDLMGGTIEVESEVGKGSRFTVTMEHKLAERTAVSGMKALAEAAVQEDILQGKRILLAEDNDLNAEIAITILEDKGCLVEHAEDGDVCVEMLEKAPAGYYDLILMDVQMPRMDGYEATRAIRHFSDQAKAAIPIVAMTANAFAEDRENAFRAGMNGFVAKPIELPKLMVAITGALTYKK
ncbi:MAG: ATP-binding protein [Lachnospiraceae bacterium]|nr:ATP-binding protein [Lachnospiraceae bacterium]